MEINEKNIKLWSTIGPRATFGLASLDFVKEFNNLMILTCDVSTSAGLERFRNSFPDSFYDCGISEQCMIASAAGYVAEGGIALASTFAPFLVLRAAEQIRLSMGYMKLPLVVTGLASGIALGYLGYTHWQSVQFVAQAVQSPRASLTWDEIVNFASVGRCHRSSETDCASIP